MNKNEEIRKVPMACKIIRSTAGLVVLAEWIFLMVQRWLIVELDLYAFARASFTGVLLYGALGFVMNSENYEINEILECLLTGLVVVAYGFVAVSLMKGDYLVFGRNL